MYEEIAPKFEQQVLQIMSQCLNIQTNSAFSYQTFETLVETHTHLEDVVIPHTCSKAFNILVGMDNNEIKKIEGGI